MERSTPLHQTVNRVLDGLIHVLTATLDNVLTFRVQRAQQADAERVEQNLRGLILYQELIREYRQETLEQEWYKAKRQADVADAASAGPASHQLANNEETSPNVQALLEQIERSPDVVLADVASGEIARQGQALTPEERAAFVRAMRGRFAWVPTSSEEFARRKQEEKELES